jgi:hypothetical protein
MFSPKKDDKEPVAMGSKILGFCFAVLLGAIFLTLALELVAQIWGWLVLIAVIVAGAWGGVVVWRRRRDGWQ